MAALLVEVMKGLGVLSLAATVFLGAVVSGQFVFGADCNGNGIDDGVDLDNGSSEDCNGSGVADECELGRVEFGPDERAGAAGAAAVGFAVGRVPRVVVVADLDGDGLADLATGNRDVDVAQTSSISILLRGADGVPGPAAELDAGVALSFMAAADLDGDGDVDLVASSPESLRVFQNRGDGSFRAPVGIAAGGGAGFVIAADVFGDGLVDLITAGRDGVNGVDGDLDVVTVLQNRSGDDLAFAAAVTYTVGAHPVSVAVGDLDGDGAADLAVASMGSGDAPGDVAVLLNRGDGSFAEGTRHAVGGEAGGEIPRAVQVGDVDGDGDRDIVVATDGGISFLLNDGTGRLDAAFGAASAEARPSAGSLVVDDLDGDGDLDLAFAAGGSGDGSRGVSVLVNDSRGRFFPLLVPVEGLGTESAMAVGDLDVDGAPDLAVTIVDPDRVIVLLNGEGHTGIFGPSYRVFIQSEPHTGVLGDFDGDGDLDLITGHNNSGSIALVRNSGDGRFAAPEFHFRRLTSFYTATADLDDDGDLDVVSVNGDAFFLTVVTNDGTGGLERVGDYPVGRGLFHVAVGDLDGDGDADLVTANSSDNTASLLFNLGDAMFEGRRDIGVGVGPVAVVVTDLDDDGDNDIAVASRRSREVSLLQNDGSGHFDRLNIAVRRGADYIVSADLDVDGTVDLATVGEINGVVSVLWNRGDWSFDVDAAISIDRRPYSLLAADVNGDERPELIAASDHDDSLTLLVNAGKRSFYSPEHFPVGGEPRFALSGDLDGNGSVDLLSVNRDPGFITVLLNQVPTFTRDYLETICTEAEFFGTSVPSHQPGAPRPLGVGAAAERVGKYILPASDDPVLLPTLFQNVSRFAFHEQFLRAVSPDRFSGLTADEYRPLIGRRDRREYFVGSLNRRVVDGRTRAIYTFSVVADTAFDPREVLGLDEIQRVYETLSGSFTLRPLMYCPDTLRARQAAEQWLEDDPPPTFPIFLGEDAVDIEYEAYTPGTGYGRVRVLTLEDFEEASRDGRFTFQDILVIDRAPRDIEGVVGGVVTAERQGPLGHVALRTARRGTPNAHVSDAIDAFSVHEGDLVRLDVFATVYCVRRASREEAVEFWSANRPTLSTLPTFDSQYRDLDHLLDIDLTGTPVARHGGKASSFAAMQHVLLADERYHRYLEDGFSIPVHAYLEFLETNTVEVGGEKLSYREFLFRTMETEEFQSDSSFRIRFLKEFRELARDEGVVDPELVGRLAERIRTVFGTPLRRVRFRSSANVEDTLEFNGAGLYESTAACAADSLDLDDGGPSLCGFQENKRTIERALKKVWASLWTFRAHEERWFFQIPQELSTMGVLVTRSFPDEIANGVALSGNPADPRDRRYFVTVQTGGVSVVSPEPGVFVERNLLEVENGEVVDIIRSRASSLVAPGEVVLSDENLRELGALMWHVEENLPVDSEGHAPEDVLLDFEFKVESDGELAVKQVRTFLVAEVTRNSPTFELEIPPETTVCGVFGTAELAGRSAGEEYRAKSTVRLRAGVLALPTRESALEVELLEEVRLGPDGLLAVPTGPGIFRVDVSPEDGSHTRFTFDYRQTFTLAGGERLTIELFGLDFRTGCDLPVESTLVLDEEFITFDLIMLGVMDGATVVSYSSCGYDLLPLWDIDVELEGGSRLHLEERFLPPTDIGRTGPASLVRADVLLEGKRQVVSDYWRLVYVARRHNRNAIYWVVLDPPLELASVTAPVHVVEYVAAEPFDRRPAAVRYLDESFAVLGSPRIVGDSKTAEPRFRRGDVNGDGSLGIADVVALLDHQFRGGAQLPCRDAADASDDGRLNISDAVLILRHLFVAASPLSEPAAACGLDPTGDELRCATASRQCE